jgi:hypothetical protein
MIRRQFPARPIRGDLEPMLHPQVAAQGFGAKPTFETDDMILLHRASDRDRRRRRFRCQRRRSSEAEGLIYGCNQARELIDSDLIFGNITPNDMRDQAGIHLLRRAFLSHIFSAKLSRGGKYGQNPCVFNFFSKKYLASPQAMSVLAAVFAVLGRRRRSSRSADRPELSRP